MLYCADIYAPDNTRMQPPEKSSILDTLSTLEGFADMGATDIEHLVEISEYTLLDAGTQVFREGDASDGRAYIILSGRVEILIGDSAVTTIESGAIFGEYALISDENRTATAITVEPTECLILGQEPMRLLASEYPHINAMMLSRIKENITHHRGAFADM